jgi:type I restriction enzyme, S subunit
VIEAILEPDAPAAEIGNFAGSWRVSRFSFEAWVRARLGWRALKAEEYVDEGFAFLSTPDIKGAVIEFEDVNFITRARYEESPEIQLRVGDVLLAKDGSTLGTVNVVRELPRPTTVNSSIAVITPGPRLDPIFLYYALQGTELKSRIAEYRAGMGVPHLFQDDIRRFPLALPPMELQRLIGAYLDAHTAKIDVLSEKQERLIETLAERRQAVISHAVTKGLDPNAAMKNSGVEWLGQVPEPWLVSSLKRVIARQTSGTSVNAMNVPVEGGEAGVLKTSSVSTGIFKPQENKTVLAEDLGRVTCPVIPGAILVNRANSPERVGAAVVVRGSFPNLYLSDKLWQILLVDADSLWLYWWLQTATYRDQVAALRVGTSSSMQNLSYEDFREIRIALPSLEVQRSIANALDRETMQIDVLSAKAREMIDELKERRQALISAAVTGKIDVRGLS